MTTTKRTVERATQADIPELVELRIAYLIEDFGGLDGDMEASIRHDLPGYFAWHLGRDCIGYVTRDADGGIASCALLVVCDKPMSPSFPTGRTGTVMCVYTRPGHRRQGHATAVISELLRDAKVMSLSVVDLQATEAGYPVYKSVGFEDAPSGHCPMRWVNPATSVMS